MSTRSSAKVESPVVSIDMATYEVDEVYLHIPAELSAANVELKIKGAVRLVDKGESDVHLVWSPADLTDQDVANLYTANADTWTLLNEVVDPAEVIESFEATCPKSSFYMAALDLQELPSIFPAEEERQARAIQAEGRRTSKPNKKPEDPGKAGPSKTSYGGYPPPTHGPARDGDFSMVTVPHSPSEPSRGGQSQTSREPINFPLASLHRIRESIVTHSSKKSLTFFLCDGREFPALYFYDGGTGGLTQALQRYLKLSRDPRDPAFIKCVEFQAGPRRSQEIKEEPRNHLEGIINQGFHGFQGAVSGITGLTRVIRERLTAPERRLLDVRPGTEDDDLIAEQLQTVTMGDSKGLAVTDKSKAITDPEMSLIQDFQVITDVRNKLGPRPTISLRQAPISLEEWESFRQPDGRIASADEQRFRARVSAGGVLSQLRKEVWKYLLGYMPFRIPDIGRMELKRRKDEEYWTIKKQWETFGAQQEMNFSRWRENKVQINKDVIRTDRTIAEFKDGDSSKLRQLEDILKTYVWYNFDLGYVQGMSDLLAPILLVMDNEVDSFWCFVGLMDMVGHHFELHQTAMKLKLKQLRALLSIIDPQLYDFLKQREAHNLYWAFRWLLVDFKREFSYDDTMKLWEVVWSRHLSKDYSLFIALAIIEANKDLLQQADEYSDVVAHINGLSMGIAIEPVLEHAEAICRQVASCPELPEDVQSLVTRPVPERPVIRIAETIICQPDSKAVLTPKPKAV